MSKPMSLLAAIELDFPDAAFSLGSKASRMRPSRPINEARFRRNLAAAARRYGWREVIATGMLIGLYVFILVIVLFSKSPYSNVIAAGGAGGGTVWCIKWMHRTNRELFVTELLLAAAQEDNSQLGDLVAFSKEILRGGSDKLARFVPEPPEKRGTTA